MKLSIILPTYNNAETLEECLESIFSQDFPHDEYEVLLIDGGSTDQTLSIVENYPVKIRKNPERAEETGRRTGIEIAQGEIIGFIDADNVVVGKDWVKKMLKPFEEDSNIAFADSIYFSSKKGDRVAVRYQALIGTQDPLAMYLGIYCRWCYLHGRWTDYPHEDTDRGEYMKSRQRTGRRSLPWAPTDSS